MALQQLLAALEQNVSMTWNDALHVPLLKNSLLDRLKITCKRVICNYFTAFSYSSPCVHVLLALFVIQERLKTSKNS